MKYSISEILGFADRAGGRSVEEGAWILRKHDSTVLRTVLAWMTEPGFSFYLPTTSIDYRPSRLTGLESILYAEMRRMYLFLPAGNQNLTPEKRLALFIELLENLHPGDAEMLVALHTGKLRSIYPNVTDEVVFAAFPPLSALVDSRRPIAPPPPPSPPPPIEPTPIPVAAIGDDEPKRAAPSRRAVKRPVRKRVKPKEKK